MPKDVNLSLVEASPTGEVDTKTCSKCNQEKPLEEFGTFKHKSGARYANSRCKECQNNASRNSNYIRKYGITVDDYNQMFSDQEGCCWICGVHQIEFGKRLCVDHDHDKEGAESVRGLLCTECNRGLGTFVDDPERLKQAIKYLEKFN